MANVKPEDIVEHMLQAGVRKAALSIKDMLLRGFLAGVFLGYAATLAILATTQTGLGIVGAVVFPIGLVMIILLGLEMVTGNFALLPLAVKDKRIDFSCLVNNWIWVFIGNLIGSVVYAFLYCIGITKMGHIDPAGIATAQEIVAISESKTLDYARIGFDGTIAAFTSAVLCNWMLTLGTVMAFTSTDTSGKILAIWLPTMTFFALDYEHAIVNMFLIPAGMMLGANITIAEWWLWNGFPVIAGNIIGGMVLTGFALYFTFKKTNH